MSSTISARVARLARFAFLAPFPPLAGFFGVASVNYDVTADGERLVMIEDEDQDAAARHVALEAAFRETMEDWHEEAHQGDRRI